MQKKSECQTWFYLLLTPSLSSETLTEENKGFMLGSRSPVVRLVCLSFRFGFGFGLA